MPAHAHSRRVGSDIPSPNQTRARSRLVPGAEGRWPRSQIQPSHAVIATARAADGNIARLTNSPIQRTIPDKSQRTAERRSHPFNQNNKKVIPKHGRRVSEAGRKTASAGTAGQNATARQLASGEQVRRRRKYSGTSVTIANTWVSIDAAQSTARSVCNSGPAP